MITCDLPELVALRGAAQGLDLRANRMAMAHLQGSHRSARRGRGLEFEEVRLYAPGDDARSIDWRVTARRGKPHTRLYREERERPVWLVADLHAGLFFGSRRQLKSALLLRTAALLGWVAANGGDRVGAVIANGDGEPVILPPRARHAGVLPVLEALVERQPRAPGVPRADTLVAALRALQPLVHPGSLVLVLSDFTGVTGGTEVETSLAAISAHCDGRLLWITDPLEQTGLPAGRFRAGWPGKLLWLDGDSTRNTWQRTWAARTAALESLAERLALPLVRVDTADDARDSLPPLLRTPRWAA